MTKKEIRIKLEMEQIIAMALLLGFDKINTDDIILLVEDFLKKNSNFEFSVENFEYMNYEYINKFVKNKDIEINKYIRCSGGKILLKDNLNLDSYIAEDEFNLNEILEQISGIYVKDYIEKFDIEEFVLRKIKHHIGLSDSDIDRLYSKNQQEVINKLLEKGYLTTYWEDDCIYDDYKIIKLSNYGELKLFKIDYAVEVERFTELLKILRYDVGLLDDFLLKQDLELPVWNILNIEKLKQFCNDFDRAINEPKVSWISFERLESTNDDVFDEEGKKVIQDMLSVWSNGDSIYICHPNHIFGGEKLLTKDVRNIKYVNWNNIDIGKMFRINDYKNFVYSDCTEAFKYVNKRLSHQIMQEEKNGNKDNAVSYLAVLENFWLRSDEYYIIRGIIRLDCNGYSIAFNPEYKKIIPQNYYDKKCKFFRFGCINLMDEPKVRCLKRTK